MGTASDLVSAQSASLFYRPQVLAAPLSGTRRGRCEPGLHEHNSVNVNASQRFKCGSARDEICGLERRESPAGEGLTDAGERDVLLIATSS